MISEHVLNSDDLKEKVKKNENGGYDAYGGGYCKYVEVVFEDKMGTGG